MHLAKVFVQVLAAAVLATAGCHPQHHRAHNPAAPASYADGLEVGAPVAARWSDGKWYYGHVATAGNGHYAIDFATGDFGTVSAGQILPISSASQIVPGAHVLAVWKGASMYPGVVLSVTNGHARVRWDDGDLPLDVPFDRIAVIGSIEQPAATAMPLTVGVRVAAKWKDGNWWYGAIGQVDSDGYVINYADGDILKVAPAAVVAIAPFGSLHVGAHVLAVWKGARMYPGVITAMNGQTATVKWDDGDVPLDVALDQIAPF